MQIRLFLTLPVLAAALCPAQASVSVPTDVYQRSIQELGGTLVDPASYPETIAGFQQFLTASSVKSVSAAELTRPNHPAVAARHGFANFLPPRSWWPRGAALALLAQRIDAMSGAAVHVRNWWRPEAYNLDPAVKGAKDGDHPTACALDLDYPTIATRMKAELFLHGLAKRAPWMQLSLGLGALTTHVGIASKHGHREWHYAGWRPAVGA